MEGPGTSGGNNYNPNAMYDITPEERRLMEERRKIRETFRKEWQFKSTHPYRHGHGGYVFDPAVQRFQSMRAAGYDYFKITPKSSFWGFATIGPIFFFAWLFKRSRDKQESLWKSGAVPYKDRDWKFA